MSPPPVSIPPPGTVRLAAVVVLLEAAALLLQGVLSLVSGIDHGADAAQLGAQVGYFVILGALLAAVAVGLLRGRRWARSPAIVAQVVALAIGMWMAFPSEQLRWGLIVIALAGGALAMLFSPTANHWIKQFPTPLGLDLDR